MTDTLALFAALNRPDLKIIALDRPFLMALPNMSRRLFFVHDDPASRMRLVRQVSGHLRSGGSALTFPAGEIEPDPDIYPGALDSLQKWTNSVGVFIRMAPETMILPVLVRNVILVDSEVMQGVLAHAGYGFTRRKQAADIIIVNTCAFIEDATKEAFATILSLAQLK